MFSIPFPQGSVTARMPDVLRYDAPPHTRGIARTGPRHHYRSLFLSDLHLGARGADAGTLLEFLTAVTADHLYLVGDVFDFCRYRQPHWTALHDRVLDRLAAHPRLTRLPGNHDPRATSGPEARLPMGPTSVIHRTASGQRYLVTHGDCAESRLGRSSMVARMGSYIDFRAQTLDDALMRRGMSGRAHRAIRWGDTLISRNTAIRTRLVKLARTRGLDGIICGHLHEPALLHEGGVTYANCGDWTRSMTALAEERDGSLSLLNWPNRSASRLTVAALLPESVPA